MAVSKLNNVGDVLREHYNQTLDKFVVTSTNAAGRIVKREPGNTSLAAIDAAKAARAANESDIQIWWRGKDGKLPHYEKAEKYQDLFLHPKGAKPKTESDVMSLAAKRAAKDVLNQHSQIANALKQDMTGQGRLRLTKSFIKSYLAMGGESDEMYDDITEAEKQLADEEADSQ